MLGWDGTKFEEDSLLKDAYDTLKTETGSSEFSALLAEFANITSNQMKDPHEWINSIYDWGRLLKRFWC
jgi:hypothetical protein